MLVKKIVISPTNTKAIAFFNELSERKAEIFKKLDTLSLIKTPEKKNAK